MSRLLDNVSERIRHRPKAARSRGWRLDTFGALRLALSRAFPPPEAANFRRFAAQRVKPAGEQFGLGRCLWCHWPLFSRPTPHASPPTWQTPHDRRGGARRRCPTPIWVQHSPPGRSQHATRCYVCRLWSRVWRVNSNLPWFSTLLAEHHQEIQLALIQPRGLSRPTY